MERRNARENYQGRFLTAVIGTDVMVKDSALFASTGGWGFEEFDRNSKSDRNVHHDAPQQCFNCHSAERDLVFSTFRK
ncbi:MAG: hypothetical protein HBSIN02_13550 [Bacteroidia bacterium]|nr:MAG: hypothetical protein HBSIN02_13550 [Bacteroidia bacterium]